MTGPTKSMGFPIKFLFSRCPSSLLELLVKLIMKTYALNLKRTPMVSLRLRLGCDPHEHTLLRVRQSYKILSVIGQTCHSRRVPLENLNLSLTAYKYYGNDCNECNLAWL